MKVKCLNEKCGKTFLYAAKETTTSRLLKNVNGIAGISMDPKESESVERHVCPFCGSLEFDEFVEPQPQIVSVKSVPIEDADALIKDGYVVLEVYAKTVNLIKKAEKPCLKERNVSNDKEAAQLRADLKGFNEDLKEK